MNKAKLKSSRRALIGTWLALWATASRASAGLTSAAVHDARDADICLSKFRIALDRNLKDRPIGDIVVEMGKTFVGTPYVASALEVPGTERLVVNMRGLDCVSFYENALVLARCIKLGTTSFDDYQAQLQFIRYRDGKIDGYPSRLHYTSDYIDDNARRGTWQDVTRSLGGVVFENRVGFMSAHPEAYRQLKDNDAFRQRIAAQEAAINARTRYFIPKDKVEGVIDQLRNGDILGTTTNAPGLDTSHTGIVIKDRGVTRFMHAPLAGKQVQISDHPLHVYLAANRGQTGIMVVRPLDPVPG